MIRGITGRLPERWKIKIGGHGEKRKSKDGGEYRLPVKYDHIRICNLEKDENDNFIPDFDLMESLGSELIDGDPKKPTVIGPVVTLYNDLSLVLHTAYRMYKGRDCMCKGNGEERIGCGDGKLPEGICDPMRCEALKRKICKPNGILSVMFPHAQLGGVAKFRTTSWNSISSLMGGLALIHLSARGKIAGLPLYLRINQTLAQVQGKAQTVYFLSVEYHGNMHDLRQEVLAYVETEAKDVLQIEHAEAKARKELALTDVFDDNDAETDPEEFYPDTQENASGALVDTKTKKLKEPPPSKKKANFGKKAPTAETEQKPAPEEQAPAVDEPEEEVLI